VESNKHHHKPDKDANRPIQMRGRGTLSLRSFSMVLLEYTLAPQ
jgi:hypothetical protein